MFLSVAKKSRFTPNEVAACAAICLMLATVGTDAFTMSPLLCCDVRALIVMVMSGGCDGVVVVMSPSNTRTYPYDSRPASTNILMRLRLVNRLNGVPSVSR